MHDNRTVRVFPLGGIGNVTKNFFVYEYRIAGVLQDAIVVDCGIGFPDESMYGVDLVIPDVGYLSDKLKKLHAILLTHAHDDHIGALPYVLPKLKVPVYATELTAAFAERKLREVKIPTKIRTLNKNSRLQLGAFRIEPVQVTHSVPDAANYVITTPIGTFYHGSDFKFDFTPLDNKPTEIGKIAHAGNNGVLCLLSDALGSERPGYTLSESVIEETLEKELRKCTGKFIFTTVSSNILRMQTMIDVAARHNRKVAFIGRSIRNNVEIARKRGIMRFDDTAVVHERKLKKVADDKLCIIVAGSQGQETSAMSRIGHNDHAFVQIRPGDVVVFSADPIPGNENAVHTLIDALTVAGAQVSYSEIQEGLHVSGHGSQRDLQLMLALTRPAYVLPIGATHRHMVAYRALAEDMGYRRESVLIPVDGEVLEFSKNRPPRVIERVGVKQVMVDGLGVGDVGEVVLRDRQTLATEGILVVVIPVERSSGRVVGEPDIISRGFVYMRESEALVAQIKRVVVDSITIRKGKIVDWQFARRGIEKNVEKFLFKETGRTPLVVPVIVEVS